jgi:hypothetical protein
MSPTDTISCRAWHRPLRHHQHRDLDRDHMRLPPWLQTAVDKIIPIHLRPRDQLERLRTFQRKQAVVPKQQECRRPGVSVPDCGRESIRGALWGGKHE